MLYKQFLANRAGFFQLLDSNSFIVCYSSSLHKYNLENDLVLLIIEYKFVFGVFTNYGVFDKICWTARPIYILSLFHLTFKF